MTGVGIGSSQSTQDGMIKEVVISTEPPMDEQMDFVIRAIARMLKSMMDKGQTEKSCRMDKG